MATKAAQRAANKAKHDVRKAEERESGLLAQEKDRLKRDEIKAAAAKRAKAKVAAALVAAAQKTETTEET